MPEEFGISLTGAATLPRAPGWTTCSSWQPSANGRALKVTAAMERVGLDPSARQRVGHARTA